MPHDPALVQETLDWLARANEDLKAAERLLSADPPLSSPAAFHGQQAAEKAQKAFLTWHQRPFTKTHNPGVLGAECVAVDPSLTRISSAVASISGYAIESRYPGPWGGPTPADAHEAIRLARELYDELVA